MDLPPRDELTAIYRSSSTIAVVGMSSDPSKDAHTVPKYLMEHGYRVIPVNPGAGSILGVDSVASLADIEVPIDVVDVFRPAAEGPDIARAAVAAGARVLWMQPGTESDEAVAIATDAGLTLVAGHCIRATHRLLGLDRAS
jgi:predicted CoA-binding protein